MTRQWVLQKQGTCGMPAKGQWVASESLLELPQSTSPQIAAQVATAAATARPQAPAAVVASGATETAAPEEL